MGGFGTSLVILNGLRVVLVTWNEKGSKPSSDFRELGNFIIRMEEKSFLSNLVSSEVFLFTYISTAEHAFHNGTASSQALLKLVLRLNNIKMTHVVRYHIIHVDDKLMTYQVNDRISR